jgi:group I intron endonuclease
MMGIYIILNQQTNKLYVGSSIHLAKRKGTHKWRLRNNLHENRYLQAVWNKYGGEFFIFKTIEVIEDISTIYIREQYWIDLLKPEYNLGNVSRPAFLGRKHTEETKKLMREKRSLQVFSEETKKKISDSRKGQKGHPISEEAKQRLMELRIKKPVFQLDLYGEIINNFKSIKEAQRNTGVDRGSISSCCNHPEICKTAGGYKWKWYINTEI